MKEIELPFPPSMNNYYGHAQKHEYIKKAGEQFRVDVFRALKKQVPGVKYTSPIAVFITLHMPDARTRDLDNYMKALWDACTLANLWTDDSLIDEYHVFRGMQVAGGKVIMQIAEVG